MATIYSIMIDIIGVPSNDIEQTLLYMVVCGFSLLFFYWVLWLFQLVANTLNGGGRRV